MNSIKIFFLLFTFIHFGYSISFADENKLLRSFFSDKAKLSALFETEGALGIDNGKFQKFVFTLEAELEVDLPYDYQLTAIGRTKFDAFDRLGFGDPSQPTYSDFTKRYLEDDHFELELRELYIDGDIGIAYIRVGKQQIVWGKADGLKVLDIVNPQTFREFILDDFDDSRIPLWSLNLEVPYKKLFFQLIWIPDKTYNQFPEQGKVFAITSTLLVPTAPPGVEVDFQNPKRPNGFISDSDIGIRISTFWKGWDLTLNYLYHYNDNPVFFQELNIHESGPTVTVRPRYRRTHLAGGTFSNAFGDITVRGEIGFNFNRFFITDNPLDNDGVEKGNEISYVIGLDWFRFTDTLISFQLFQNIILNVDEIVDDKFENTITLLIKRDFMYEVLEFEVLWLQNLNRGDGLVRPKIFYELSDNILLKAGYDIFYGDIDGVFGQFRGKDRVTFGFEYGFST